MTKRALEPGVRRGIVETAMTRAGARRQGLPALRRSLRRCRPGAAGLKHELERTFHRFRRRHGFPQAELDAGPHATTRNFHGDRRCAPRLGVSHDVLTVRVAHRDVDEDEATLAADLRALIERRSA